MQKKKTIFDFLGQVFFLFGIMMLLLIVLCLIFGDGAKDISNMFSMGSFGLSIHTMLQFFAVSIITTGARFLFFNDAVLKKASITVRTACMLLTIVLTIIFFICKFAWFPINMWQPWVMFAVSFGICFGVSLFITYLKEKLDNRNMESALNKLKERME